MYRLGVKKAMNWYTTHMKVAIINDIHASNTRRNERLVSDLALEKLATTLEGIKQLNPDYLLILGDLIFNIDASHDAQYLEKVLTQLEPFKDNCIITSGNHEGRSMGLESLQGSVKQAGFNTRLYGLVEEAGRSLIYLGSNETQQNGKRHDFLPEEQLHWLDETLSKLETEVIICMHHFPFPTPHRYNYYVEVGGADHSYIQNTDQLQLVLKKHLNKVKLILCAHSHWLQYNQTTLVPLLSLPAYSENLLSEVGESTHPQSWSLLDWQEAIQVNCFSGGKYSWGQVVF